MVTLLIWIQTYHFLVCPDNAHVNNLVESKTKIVENWTITVDYGPWTVSSEHKPIHDKCGQGQAWYGWNRHYHAGVVNTTLSGNAHGRLLFGNCWTSGIVQVYLNGRVIGYANHDSPTNVIEFDYYDGSKLEIRDAYGNAVIQFHKFEVVKCIGKLILLNTMHQNIS